MGFIKSSTNKKDFIIINPPYFKHIEIFIKCFHELNFGGTLICLHPATPFLSRKIVNEKPSTKTIKKIVSDWEAILTLLNGNELFDINQEAPLSLTRIKKVKNKNIKVVNNYYKKQNKTITYTNLDDIFIHGNLLVNSIKEKIDKQNTNSIEENLFRKTKKYKKYLLKVNAISTGVPKNGKPSGKFQSIISKKYENSFDELLYTEKTTENTSNEITFDSEIEALNCFDYLLTKFSRFAVSTLKLNQNLHRGELRAVPYLDFTQEWDDEKLFNYFGFTQEEIDFVNEYIQDWYEQDTK